MSEGIVEIRDYTIEEKWFAKYKEWANEFAAPWLKKKSRCDRFLDGLRYSL